MEEAWESGDPASVFAELEMVAADSLPGPIIVWNNDRMLESNMKWVRYKSARPMWYFNLILEEPPVDVFELSKRDRWHHQMVLEGMEHCWYALGMFECDPRFLPLIYDIIHEQRDPPRTREENLLILKPWVEKMIRSLPALAELDGRICRATGRNGGSILPWGFSRSLGLFANVLRWLGVMPTAEGFRLLQSTAPNAVATIANLELPWTK